jgi:hypothetical protein
MGSSLRFSCVDIFYVDIFYTATYIDTEFTEGDSNENVAETPDH